MHRDRSTMRRLATSLLLGPALLLVALAVPAGVAAAGPITSSACAPTGPTAVTCDLWAKTGTLALPGTSTPIWGFSASAAGAASVPGPVLIVNSGDAVTVNLTNQLSVTTSILFDGQPVAPDLTGVVAGATKAYAFTAGAPGTYLYEAGLLPGTQYQVAKGLYGALDRPTRRWSSPGQRQRVHRVRRRGARRPRRGRHDAQLECHPGHVRPAQVRPALLPDQRRGLPADRRRSRRRAATACSCGTWTRASSTTPWACSACVRPS